MEDNLSTENTIEVPVKEKKTFSTLPKDEWILLIILVASNALCPMSFSSIATFYLAVGTKKGLTISEVGVIFGIFNLLSFFLSPFIGKLITIFGVKKIFYNGVFIIAFGTLAFSLTNLIDNHYGFLAATLTLRLIQSGGSALALTTSFTIISNQFPDLMSSMLGWIEVGSGSGAALGPFLGGIIYEFNGGSYPLPFLIFGSILAIIGVLSVFYIKDFEQKCEEEEMNIEQLTLTKMMKIKDIWFVLITVFSVGVIFYFNSSSLPIAIQSFKLMPSQIGIFYLIVFFCYSVTAPLFGYLIDRYPISNILLVMGNIMFIFYLVIIGPASFLPFKSNLYSTTIALIFLAISGSSLFIPSYSNQKSIVINENGFPDNIRTNGIISAAFTSVFSLGSFIGSVAGTFSVDLIGYRATTSIFLCIESVYFILFIALFIIPRYLKRNYKKHNQIQPAIVKNQSKVAFYTEEA
uniref:MFS domain-containing protein n=1 Tax=Rhabditophanes sp. KR3021 TaxID=114890 RepID=A0AC35U1J9_9BILA